MKRKIGYGVSGLLIGVITYLILVTGIPDAVTARSTRNEFSHEEKNDDYISREDDYEAGSIVPFLEFGSYRVTPADFTNYEINGTVKYGKANPMFFWHNVKSEISDDKDNQANKESNNDKSNENEKEEEEDENVATMAAFKGGPRLTEPTLEGFNIHTRQNETLDISNIRDVFQKEGALPVDEKYYNVTSPFGGRMDPFKKVKAYHVGTDISADNIDGTNVYVAASGKIVESVSSGEGYGNYVVIEHDGFETLYAHMKSAPLFKVGDKVEAGDVLGYIGSTGRSTGPHLHFEIGIGGVKFDAELFINEIGRND